MTYTGSLARRLVGAEDLLCRSTTFRERVGAADINAAKDRVYVGELTDVLELALGGTLQFKRPCAILGCDRHSYALLAQNGQPTLGASGAVWVLLVDNATNPDSHKLSMLDFVDWTSQVTDEVAALVGSDGGAADYTLWPFGQIVQFLEPFRPDLADRLADDFWVTGYVLIDAIGA